MIVLYSGTPGSGKSLHVASDIKYWLHKKRAPVIANFDFSADSCRPKGNGCYLQVSNSQLHPWLLEYFSEEYRKYRGWERVPEEHILFVVDEAQLVWNSREWQARGREGWVSFFTQHRKLGYHIIMITQFQGMLDKQIRTVLEYEYMHRKVANIGMGGKVFNFVAGGQLHVCSKIYVPLKLNVGTEWFKGNRTLYKLYDSYTRFDAVRPAMPSAAGGRHAPDAAQGIPDATGQIAQ